ncbi:DMT family transporter [Egbenema bharatensis]|uniref:DMT family transporter n=1 Tax=Egbenema bharatensis TaxID=3463334 RepID=UPI003A8A0A4A
MSSIPLTLTTLLALFAFAGNSLLCRLALQHTLIDASSFTSIRLISGAAMLWLIVRCRNGYVRQAGNWTSALALFTYAACFSIAYVSLPAAVGALLLFGAVQITMIGYGLWTGERLRRLQIVGLVSAFIGLIGLLLPGLSTPPLQGSVLMLGAGIAWGIYSLRGRRMNHPVQATAGNFGRTVPLVMILSLMTQTDFTWDSLGAGYAIISGAIASAGGYVLWYKALPQLHATQAATVQLSVPILAAVGAIGVLNEPITLRLGLTSIAVLGGIALVIHRGRNEVYSGQLQPQPLKNNQNYRLEIK